ncbi:MAG: hypothetical protein ACO3NK_08350 [Prochlorotrichaceae cyanobacterium]
MDPRIEVELARQYLVRNWQSVSNCSGWSFGKYQDYARLKDPMGKWQTLPDRILAASPHLQGISGHERRLDELLQTMPLLEALEIIDREFG